jgi:hypothetical protein
MEKQGGMAFVFRKTATAVIKPVRWIDNLRISIPPVTTTCLHVSDRDIFTFTYLTVVLAQQKLYRVMC